MQDPTDATPEASRRESWNKGKLEDGRVAHYQVTLKVGFTLDDD